MQLALKQASVTTPPAPKLEKPAQISANVIAEQVKRMEEAVIHQQRRVVCDKCQHLMKERTGAHGAFLGCTNYPECKNTKSLTVPKRQPAIAR